MDFERFIVLLERFFERANTILHKKGEHYTDTSSNPSFLLIDEGRSTYYLAELALPPDVPMMESLFRAQSHAYAKENKENPYIISLIALLGRDFSASKEHVIDDLSLDPVKLQKKSALVVADAVANDVIAFLDHKGIEYQSVPLKGIFTILFFVAEESEKFVKIFQQVEEYAKTHKIDVPAELEKPKEQKKSDVVASKGAASKEEKAKEVKEKKEKVKSSDGGGVKVNWNDVFQKFAIGFSNLCSFLLFMPAFLLNKVSKGRIPDAIAYCVSAVAVSLGLYYYLFTIAFGKFTNLAEVISLQKLTGILAAYSLMDTSFFTATKLSSSLVSVIGGSASWGALLLSFDKAILQLLNTPYYLKYLIALGFVLAIVPAFRVCGKRIICFMIVSYIFYIPVLVVGSIFADKAISAIANPNMLLEAGIVNQTSIFMILSTATSGVLVIACLIPLITVIVARKISKCIGKDL